MCAYQAPEVYVKHFIESVLKGVEGVELYEEMRVSHLRFQADYGIENIVIEAEPPCYRSRGREQIKEYMKRFNRSFGLLIDIPTEKYYREYPNACREKVGFEIYTWFGNNIDAIYIREFDVRGSEKEAINVAAEELRNIVRMLKKLRLLSPIAKVKPTPEYLIAKVRDLIENYTEALKKIISGTSERVKAYFNIWRNTMELIYGKDVIESIKKLDELFINLTIYVTWLKCLGVTLLEAALGGGRYSIPIKLYLEGYKAAIDLFWHRKALVRFNIDYLFERDEYDWVFDPEIAPQLDAFFKKIGEFLLSVDWSQEVELDLLKRIYQNVVPREVRRQFGEFYTPDWVAQVILWRALHILVKGSPPQEAIVPNPIDRSVELIDEFYKKHKRVPRFIDPTCGSFTFGVHYISALLKWYIVKKVPIHPIEFARQIMDSVVGIDLNPVAVITAKVNYLLQIHRLLAIHGEFLAEQPIIPILRVDLLNIHVSSGKEGQKTIDTYFVGRRGGSITIRIPLESLSMGINEDFLNRLRKKGVSVNKGKEVNIHYVEISLPLSILDKAKNLIALARGLIALPAIGIKGFENEVGVLNADERRAVEEFRRVVLVLEEEGLDIIWHSLALNNALALYLTRKKFDLVLGNLPWVNVSAYPKGYAELLRSVAKELGVSPPSQAAKKLDISIPLFAIALRYLASSPSVTALMVPVSIFRGLHGASWRRSISSPPHAVIEVWDLEDVKPFEGADNQPGIVFVLKR
jgi:hypothetical protein